MVLPPQPEETVYYVICVMSKMINGCFGSVPMTDRDVAGWIFAFPRVTNEFAAGY